MKKTLIFLTMCIAVLTACEKPITADDQKSGHEDDANVVLRLSPYLYDDFGTRGTALTDQLTKVSVAIFSADGTKMKNITQKQGDAGFGEVDVLLTPGTYKVVAVAHNATEGNATITSTEKVTFASNKMTDTFSCCETLTVPDGLPIEEELLLQRVVAMVRLTVTGSIPTNVAQFKFYYTGGSSTLNPSTGYGCVQSKQTEYRPTVIDGSAVKVYELYTAPHELNDVLKITITALGSDGAALNEWTMENVPVTKNKITTWTGSLFGGGTPSGGGITITLDTTWDGTISYTW
jgi:hypothetical protein